MLLKLLGTTKKTTEKQLKFIERSMKTFIVIGSGVIANAMAAVFTPADISLLKDRFLQNVTPNGAIMASPSRNNPDYYYDWIRDSGLAMGLIERWYERSKNPEDKARLMNYIAWSEKIQRQANPNPGQDILGEPKFYLDGRVYDGQWGRPQNDGPALRALTLIRFAKRLLEEKNQSFVEQHLYNGTLDPHNMGVVKTDLEYIAHHWREKNFDLWEEVYGDHFFTAMVQRAALLEGAELARQMQDFQAAAYYCRQAELLKMRLYNHISKDTGYIDATLAPHEGPQKTFELDTAVILASLLNYEKNDVFMPDNEYIRNTADALKKQFKTLYPINKKHTGAILFGRYPGDTYDGHRVDSLGNPWFILTATMAEYHYKLAEMEWRTNAFASKDEVRKHIKEGDAYLQLIKTYAPDLYLHEQINRETGERQGASSLTWSYIAVLRAIEARPAVFESSNANT